MTNRVIVQHAARMDILDVYSRAAANPPVAAEKWLDRVTATLHTLSENPQRCPPAFENNKVVVELRELLFGK